MKRLSLVLVVLAVVAVAVIVAVAIDGNNAAAAPDGWTAGFCGACHNGGSDLVAPAAHNVPSHSALMGSCTNCHSSVPAINITTCGACHGGVDAIANSPGHGTSCVDVDCHAAVVTTTTQATTTTTAATTTTTAATTTTTAGTTTTTEPGGTTTTTAPATTTTTLPTGQLPVTG